MKRLIFFSFLLLIFQSCSSDEPQQVNIDSAVDIRVSDAEGNDLLDPSSEAEAAIDVDRINIFHIVGGEEIKVSIPRADSPKGFALLYPEGEHTMYRLRVFLNGETGGGNTTASTIIEWSGHDRDVIIGNFSKGDNFLICTRIWFNGETVWDTEHYEGDRSFEIIK